MQESLDGRGPRNHHALMTDNAILPQNMTKDSPSLGQKIKTEIKFFVKLFAGLCLFFLLGWGQYKIPSESMQPTLEVGDHLFVAKFAYGYSRHSLPLGLHKLPIAEGKRLFSRTPQRGSVVVFRNPVSDIVMIKRLIGVPGDTLRVSGGRLFINDEMIERKPLEAFLYREHNGSVVGVDSYAEQLPGEKTSHIIYEQTDQAMLDNAGPFIIPEDHLFFMGDNRDNSVDSRAPTGLGFVPLDHVIGRADLMLYSLKRCRTEEGLRCPPIRAFKPL